MNKPIVNPASEKIIESTVKNMPQSILITGDFGVGLGTICKYIASLNKVTPIMILPEKDEKIDLEKGIISVDIMRRLYDEARTKTKEKRIIVIDFAERMTHQAQNAFLKLLEEPNDNMHFILASHTTKNLLPTILSRVNTIKIKPITTNKSQEFIKSLNIKDETKIAQLLFIAGGLPAEMYRLANDEEYFKKRSDIIRDAREMLRGERYQKLIIAQKYKDDRAGALVLLNDMANIIKKSISANPQIETIKHIDLIIKTIERIEANSNIRLCLARLIIP